MRTKALLSRTQRYQPPADFAPAGTITFAEFAKGPPPFIMQRKLRLRGNKAEGLRYEARGHEYLGRLYPDWYIPAPWLRFSATHNQDPRWCQPDGIIMDLRAGRITIIEFKLRHTSRAWWQLRRLYEPVLTFMFPKTLWRFSVCEVVRWFDPQLAFPETFRYAETPNAVMSGSFGVHIWQGKRQWLRHFEREYPTLRS